MYINKTVSGGGPETDVIVMFKMLVLQQWHGLSDFELEKVCIDRIFLGNSLDFLNTYLTVLLYSYLGRELSKISKKIWGKLQGQLDTLGLQIKQGMIQDATFIHSDPGHAKAER